MAKFGFCVAASVLWINFLVTSPAQATSIYLNIPSIPGEDPVPGYPGAIAVQSLTITSHSFSVVKDVDKTSPQIEKAVVEGKLLDTASVLLYNKSPTTSSADVTLSFPNIFADSYQLMNGGARPLEKDGFASTIPALLYLDLPGVKGESSLPGYPDVIQIHSFSLTGDGFSIIKDVDKASPLIEGDVLRGASFPTARLLLYDSTAADTPYAIVNFQNLVASSFQLQGGISSPLQEQDGFNFESISSDSPRTAPEPSSLTLVSIVAVGLVVGGRRRLQR
jgi:type VI protein secretion system component Hcp